MSERRVAELLRAGMDRHEINEDATVADAIDVMKQTRSHCLLVTDRDRQPVGVLSEHDIVKAFAQEGDNAKTSYICDYMTPKIISVRDTDTVDTVIDLMTEKNIRHIPVMNDNGIVRGFISIMELLRACKGL